MKDFFKKITPLTIIRTFHWRIIVIILMFTTIFAAFSPKLITVNENQILYYMSCLAQVIAALYALILAAYTIADTRLKSLGTNDDTLLDYIPEIQNEHFQHIIIISVNCITTIFLCFATINTYSVLPQKIFSIMIMDTSMLGGISTILLIFFVLTVCDPNAFQQKGESVKDEMDKTYKGDKKTDDFRMFLGYYNRLEALISKLAIELSGNFKYYNKYQRRQMQIFQSLDILMSHNIFDKYIYAKIDEFRRYRNALVHSTNPEFVSSTIYKDLKEVYEKLEIIYTCQKNNSGNIENAISSLSTYCQEHLPNNSINK